MECGGVHWWPCHILGSLCVCVVLGRLFPTLVGGFVCKWAEMTNFSHKHTPWSTKVPTPRIHLCTASHTADPKAKKTDECMHRIWSQYQEFKGMKVFGAWLCRTLWSCECLPGCCYTVDRMFVWLLGEISLNHLFSTKHVSPQQSLMSGALCDRGLNSSIHLWATVLEMLDLVN